MSFEKGKCYKHKKGLYVMAMGTDVRGFIDVQYSDGREGKLIPEAPGWAEITDKEWFKAIKEHRVEAKEEEKKEAKKGADVKEILKLLD